MSDCSTIEIVVFWSSATEVFNGAFKQQIDSAIDFLINAAHCYGHHVLKSLFSFVHDIWIAESTESNGLFWYFHSQTFAKMFN